VPIPGTRKLHRLEENIDAAETELSTDELTEIEDAASKIQVQGGHYSEASERMTNLQNNRDECKCGLMTEHGRFSRSTALVTGAGHGIGRACARRLAGEGARVVITDLDLDAAREVEADLSDGPGRHLALTMDVTNRSSVDEAVGQAVGELGGLDVVVNVAGGDTAHGAFEETGDEIWLRLLDLNLVGVARVCRAAIPFLRRSDKAPAIVTVSSINANVALGSEPYSSAKAGLTALTRNLAVYLAPDGVRVNAVAPGTIRTRVWDGQEGGAERMKPLYPLGRVGEPEDVAAAVAFLASTDAAWITGHTLPVEGGLLLAHPAI
jgi:meso-butanediol dehydrogenase / (S,S)-butanediol dehydrogenase / diacetyl reductase